MKQPMIVASILAASSVAGCCATGQNTDFLRPRIDAGARISNIFSIASSTKADGFDELVRRNGGHADYSFEGASPDHDLTFSLDDSLLGDRAAGHAAKLVIRDAGATLCFDGDCQPSTSASGLVYNPRLWGVAPARLKAGMSWRTTIQQAWQLGAGGDETVTVTGADDRSGTVTLKREGSATGPFADEPGQVTLIRNGAAVTFDVTPGAAHWIGYATFQRGFVISDELFVSRTDQLKSNTAGAVVATKHIYMLLAQAPYPTQ